MSTPISAPPEVLTATRPRGSEASLLANGRGSLRSAAFFRLALPMWMPHLPGQHYDVRLTAPDGYRAQRSYSAARGQTSGYPLVTLSCFVDQLGGQPIERPVSEINARWTFGRLTLLLAAQEGKPDEVDRELAANPLLRRLPAAPPSAASRRTLPEAPGASFACVA